MNNLAITSSPSKAYQAANSMPSAAVNRSESKPPVRSFSEMVEQTAVSTLETIREGDHAAVAGLKGEMSTQQVVEATMAMETALQVTVAVRDKVLEAYQEVMRMAV